MSERTASWVPRELERLKARYRWLQTRVAAAAQLVLDVRRSLRLDQERLADELDMALEDLIEVAEDEP